MFELIDFLIVRPIINILFLIYNYIGDFGITIILFTVIVKLITWPIMKKQLYHVKTMKKLGPELAQIRKNCKGNKQLELIQMNDLYKRHNIKPFRSILNLFIQIPIFIALFTAIHTMVIPTTKDNISIRAYPVISQLDNVQKIIKTQNDFLEQKTKTYNFKPTILNIVDLSIKPGTKNYSSIILLIFAILTAFIQYLTLKQTSPSNKNIKKRSFKQVLQDSKDGKDPDPTDINAAVSEQMTKTMPLMILMISFSLPGALVFYYLVNSSIGLLQQKIIMNKADSTMDDLTDKNILKELDEIKEAKIVNKTKITRISAKDDKKLFKKGPKK